MVNYPMNYRTPDFPPALIPRKPLLFRTYKNAPSQPLWNQQLLISPVTAHSKGFITTAESAVTKFASVSRLKSAVTKKWGIPPLHLALFREGAGINSGDKLEGVFVVDLFQHFVIDLEAVNAPERVALAVILHIFIPRFKAPEIPLVFVHFVDVFPHQHAILILRQKVVRGI